MLKIQVSSKRRGENGRKVWVLTSTKPFERPWLGRLREYDTGKDHGMEPIRESLARSRRAEGQ